MDVTQFGHYKLTMGTRFAQLFSLLLDETVYKLEHIQVLTFISFEGQDIVY